MILYKSPGRGRVAAPFCLTTFLSPPRSLFRSLVLPSFPLPPLVGAARARALARISLRCLLSLSLSLFVLIFAILDPRFSTFAFLALSLSLSVALAGRARDRRSYRWQRDPFVLSRRFQLIFIVYLPDQRYTEDNGPPRYIRALANHVTNAEVYLLSPPPLLPLLPSLPFTCLSPHPRLIRRRRIA